MRDPISGKIDLVFFAFALLVMMAIAIDPKRVLEFVFPSAVPIRSTTLTSLRVLAIFCSIGLSTMLIAHFAQSR